MDSERKNALRAPTLIVTQTNFSCFFQAGRYTIPQTLIPALFKMYSPRTRRLLIVKCGEHRFIFTTLLLLSTFLILLLNIEHQVC